MINHITSVIFRRWKLKALLSLTILILFSSLSNWWMINTTNDQIYNSLDEVPSRKVALVLGANAKYRNGVPNLYFKYRMEAAAELYHSQKVKHVLVSGDNHTKGYNEPEDMKNALIALGVASSDITLDYAGFRTFDSMIRSKEVFGINKFIVVSQRFHLERALYIANSNDIYAIGYEAQSVRGNRFSLREYLAKAKAVLDCSIFFTQPKFLGKKEFISIRN